MTLSLGACSSVGIETSQAPGTAASPCDSAYSAARIDERLSAPGNPLAVRYLALGNGAGAWNRTAASCPSRFAEGTMRSALALHLQAGIAPQLQAQITLPDAATQNLDNVAALDVSDTALKSMALAEDRAGFETGVLAARQVDGASLALSDGHRAVASRLISLQAPGAKGDPRQKVYDTSALLAAPNEIDDPATGLKTPVLAASEMNCARAEIAAIADDSPAAAKSGATAGKGSDDTAQVLANLVISRISLALQKGYPAFDAALFD
ncbi:hypothetical protein PT282_02085 [Bifidobacterium sp. ESL0763]|uniref:hypothetical protein n=1 Tax=Bifidobacterium sp. ESL0763 TaxID=2983227 RepID=UPI0023F98D72|nr:hypothetical protein [Bifidobacterium sp. ESL0763]MDF7663467.1 hypothetical protein [Bifidobacterium sp. ESL0763]